MKLNDLLLNIKHEIDSKTDNVSNSPKKPSDYKSYQNGFHDCFLQIENIIEKLFENMETENGKRCAYCGVPKDMKAGLARDGLTNKIIRCPFHE